MKVYRLPPVDAEFIEAVFYYRGIEPGLGERLVREFEVVIQRIVRFPQGSRLITPNLRQCALKAIPYVVIYALQEDQITVVAFADTHRRLDHWRERLNSL